MERFANMKLTFVKVLIMNTYTSSYPVDTTYSYAPYTYSNYYSPSTSYCPCCSSTASYCPQQMQSSTSTSPVYFNNNQV